MRIAVCVKPVPDLASAYVSKSRSELVEQGKRVPNPADENALQMALDLRNGGEVVAFMVGGEEAQEALRPILAMGADRAYLVTDPLAQEGDALADAKVLAAAIRRAGDFDLVLCGARSVVHGMGQVGPRLAEALGLPQAARVTAASVTGGQVQVERAGSLGPATIALPALLTVEPGANTPQLPNAIAVMKAARKPLESPSLEELGVSSDESGLAGAGARLRLTQVP